MSMDNAATVGEGSSGHGQGLEIAEFGELARKIVNDLQGDFGYADAADFIHDHYEEFKKLVPAKEAYNQACAKWVEGLLVEKYEERLLALASWEKWWNEHGADWYAELECPQRHKPPVLRSSSDVFNVYSEIEWKHQKGT